MSTGLDALISAARELRDIEAEVERLRKVEEWALAQLPFAEGEAVVVAKDLGVTSGSGWWPYREILVPGSTGTVWGIYLRGGQWFGMFRPDVQWSVSDYPAPSGTVFARSQPTSFALRITDMRRRKKKDAPLTMPPDARPS